MRARLRRLRESIQDALWAVVDSFEIGLAIFCVVSSAAIAAAMFFALRWLL